MTAKGAFAKEPDVELGEWVFVAAVLLACLGVVAFRPLVAMLVRRRFGGYRKRFNPIDPRKPWAASKPRNIAVIGGGLAGIAAAHVLSERGHHVELLEKNAYLGGKIGSWTTRLSDGRVAPVSHGFHAFFRHYYNLNRFLDRLGLRHVFRSIEDYVILRPDGRDFRFAHMSPVPILNLLSLRRSGFYRLRDILFTRARDTMHVFFRYHPQKTFEQYDGISFHDFAERAQLPPRLRLAFNSFSRAFFSEPKRLSTAELMKSIHFYYFGHDLGLVYDHPTADYGEALLEPIRARLEANGVEIRLASPVQQISRVADGWSVDGRLFDFVVVAADVQGVASLGRRSPDDWGIDLDAIAPGQAYIS
ncbi:MAG: FAD-dependent oxidoreductase, partial [Myxococcales bacterium]|nr:FAD-dependent oxidoreductase [Myxococcales bacterium]